MESRDEGTVIVGAGIAGHTASLGLHRTKEKGIGFLGKDKAFNYCNLVVAAVVIASFSYSEHLVSSQRHAHTYIDTVTHSLGLRKQKKMESIRDEDIVIVGGLATSLGLHRNVTTLITGQQKSTTALTNAMRRHGAHEVRCVRWQLLLEALANELPSGTIRYSSKVVAIEESGFTKLVHLADETVIRTKVLIGCDGVNSAVAKWLGLSKGAFSG